MTKQQLIIRNEKGQFVNGHKCLSDCKEEKNNCWKGGISRPYMHRILKDSGRDISKCQICSWIKESNYPIIYEENKLKNSKRIIIHHIDGNEQNNKLKNLAVLCDFCHNAIHDNPNRKATRFQEEHEVPIEWRKKFGEKLKGKKQNSQHILKRVESIKRNHKQKLYTLSMEST